jgi:prevent-host-death family protein
MQVNIHQAKTHLSRLWQRVVAGEEVTIARSGVPVARLVAVKPNQKKTRPLGKGSRTSLDGGRRRTSKTAAREAQMKYIA